MYNKTHAAHSNHTIQFDDGSQAIRYCRYEKGLITGKYRDMPALIADEGGFDGLGFDASIGSNDDNWRVLNIFKNGGKYVESVAIAGAMDDDHALTIADTQFDYLGGDYSVIVALSDDHQFDNLGSQGDTWSVDAITKLMNNPSQDKYYLPVITAPELATEATRVTFDSVAWDGINIVSHGGQDASLYRDMVKVDTKNELVADFDLREALASMDAETVSFDSLMDTNNRLPLLKDRLFNAMSRANNGELSVTNVTQTKPFKRQGVANVAFVFDLSDGQKLSIWFHNPDSTPSKLMASDIMISWKWLLNKRDVTAVLSPKNGDNVQLPVLAQRMMRLAAKNSARFKRTQARKAKIDADLDATQKQISEKEATINQLDQEIESLQKQIDEAMQKPQEIKSRYLTLGEVRDAASRKNSGSVDNKLSEDTEPQSFIEEQSENPSEPSADEVPVSNQDIPNQEEVKSLENKVKSLEDEVFSPDWDPLSLDDDAFEELFHQVSEAGKTDLVDRLEQLAEHVGQRIVSDAQSAISGA